MTDTVFVPMGTRFCAVRRHPNGWAAWTAVSNMSVPYQQWYGTYYLLADDGSVTRVDVRREGYDDETLIKPKDR